MTRETNTSPEAVAAMIAELRDGRQICGACGQPWTGEKCGQADNGWDHPVCYPTGGYDPNEAADLLDAMAEQCKAQARDLAMVKHSLKLGYDVRAALGRNDKHSLDIMPDAIKRMVSDFAAARATIAERDAEIARQSADRASLWENWNKSTETFRATIARLTRENAEAAEAERERILAAAIEYEGRGRFSVPAEWGKEYTPSQVYETGMIDAVCFIKEDLTRARASKGENK